MSKQTLLPFTQITRGILQSLTWEIISLLMSVPASILINRGLGAEERGLFSLLTLTPIIIITIGTCQWNRIVTGLLTSHKISSQEAYRKTVYYTKILSYIVIPSGIFICLLQTNLPLNHRVISSLYILTFPFIMFSTSISSICIGSGSISNQYWIRLSFQASYLGFTLILYLSNQLSLSWLFAIHAISWTLSFMIANKIASGLSPGEISSKKPSLVNLVKNSGPYALEIFSSNVDVLAFSLVSPVVILGYYAGISGIMQPISIVSNALISGSTAKLNWNNLSSVISYLFKSMLIFSGLAAGVVFLSMEIGPSMLELFLGKSYEGGRWMIPWIGGIVICKSISLQFHSSVQLAGFNDEYIFIQTLEAFFRVGLVFCFGLFLKEYGVIIGLLLSYMAKSVACVFIIISKKSELST